MKNGKKFAAATHRAWDVFWRLPLSHGFFFWPLIAMAGRLVMRVVLNVWDMIET